MLKNIQKHEKKAGHGEFCSSTSLSPCFLRPQPFPLLANKKTELRLELIPGSGQIPYQI